MKEVFIINKEAVKHNIFYAAHPAIEDWDSFPWHRRSNGQIETWKVNSSQAMVIDVFGSIKVSSDRDVVMHHLAKKLGLQGHGKWNIELEWPPKELQINLLNEIRPTQVDVMAKNDTLIILFEGKLSETEGGRCSQPVRRLKGPQCAGKYELQTNPANGIESRCALSGKGIKYWDYIPKVFNIDPTQDHKPCPFAGSSYQWMRNIVLGQGLAEQNKKQSAFVLVYADSPQLHMRRYIASEGWQQFRSLLRNNASVTTISFQEIVALAHEANPDSDTWPKLSAWIDRKIKDTKKKVTNYAQGKKEQQ